MDGPWEAVVGHDIDGEMAAWATGETMEEAVIAAARALAAELVALAAAWADRRHRHGGPDPAGVPRHRGPARLPYRGGGVVMMVWLVWDGLYEDRDVHSVHATQAGAIEQAAELIGQHEVSRARDAVAYPDRGMYRQPVQHHTSTDCESWSTAVWEVSVERRDVERRDVA